MTDYFTQIISNQKLNNVTDQIKIFVTKEPVKAAFVSGVAIGSLMGMRNIILFGIGTVSIYYWGFAKRGLTLFKEEST